MKYKQALIVMHLHFGNGGNKKGRCSKLRSVFINNMFWCRKVTIYAFELFHHPRLHDPERSPDCFGSLFSLI